ncbi:MAG: DUF4476 domain-containing protein [Bacteroidota bacterium]
MKRIIYLLTVLLLANLGLAQTSNLIIFHEDGEAFTLYLNGTEKNEKPKANVKVTDLDADFYKAKITFNNKSLGSFKKSIWFEEKGKAYTFRIHRKNNGKFTLRPVSQTELTDADTPDTPHDNEAEYEDPQDSSGEVHESTETHSHTTEVEGGSTHDGESVNMHMNVDDSGMHTSMKDKQEGIDVNVQFETDGELTQTTSTTTTTTTTVTHGGETTAETNNQSTHQETQENNTSTSGNCNYPMGPTDFSDAKSSIESKSFNDSKLTLAKQIAKNECLESSQVKEIMEILSYEDTRLEFAKFAWDYVYDPQKYYKVNDAFEFEMTIEELDEYLDSKQ